MINAFFMIKYTNEDKTLTVPSGLGNFAMNGGGGGDVTRQDVINIVDSAITEYDTEIQVDLEDIRENVSGNTDNIEALSATTENMAQSIGAINTNIEALSAVTDNMASNVEALSAATGNIQSNVESISGQTSANTAHIETISAATEALSATTEDIYNEIFYEDGGERYSYIADLQDAMEGKQDTLEAGSGISINDNVVSLNPPGRGISLSEGGRLQINAGSGLTVDGDNNLSVEIGNGLAFSGNTLVVSGGSQGESNYVIVDDLGDIDEPYEGLMARVRLQSAVTSNIKIYIADPQSWQGWDGDRPEGYIGQFTDGQNEALALYLSTETFHWGWENDGAWHTRDYYGNNIVYRTHNVDGNGGAWFEIETLPNGVSFEFSTGAGSAVTTTTEYFGGKSYVYRDEAWIPTNGYHIMGNPANAFANSGETDDFVNEIVREVEAGYVPVIHSTSFGFPIQFGEIGYDGDGHVSTITFAGNRGNDMRTVYFSSIYGTHDDNGFNSAGVRVDYSQVADTSNHQRTINLTTAGTLTEAYQLGVFGEEDKTDQIVFKIDGDYASWSQAPVKWVYRTRAQEEDPLVYYWSVEIPVNGTLYRGVWHVTENDWDNYTQDSWTSV